MTKLTLIVPVNGAARMHNNKRPKQQYNKKRKNKPPTFYPGPDDAS